MKRTIIILFALLPMLMQAGVIMKRSGERLEDVTIKSVTDSEIVYELNGQEVIIPKSEVSAILYDNGHYEEIKSHKAEAVEPVGAFVYDEQEAKRIAQEQKKLEAEEKRRQQAAEKAAALEKARAEEEQKRIAKEQARIEEERKLQDGQIHRINSNSWYYIDKYYSKKEITSIILTDCPDAQQYYKNAKKWAVGGWSGAGVGLAMTVVGGILVPIGIENENYWWRNSNLSYNEIRNRGAQAFNSITLPGIIFLTVGSAGFVTSFTIACIGHHRMNNAYKIYNASCSGLQEPSLSLNFGPTSNGLGLTIMF